MWQSTKSRTCISKQAWLAQRLISFVYQNVDLFLSIIAFVCWTDSLGYEMQIVLVDFVWCNVAHRNGMECNVSLWQLCLLGWMSQIKRFILSLCLFALFFHDQGITFEEFRSFFQFLNNLEDFAIAMQMYNFACRSIGQGEILWACHCISTIVQIKKTPKLADPVTFDLWGKFTIWMRLSLSSRWICSGSVCCNRP